MYVVTCVNMLGTMRDCYGKMRGTMCDGASGAMWFVYSFRVVSGRNKFFGAGAKRNVGSVLHFWPRRGFRTIGSSV